MVLLNFGNSAMSAASCLMNENRSTSGLHIRSSHKIFKYEMINSETLQEQSRVLCKGVSRMKWKILVLLCCLTWIGAVSGAGAAANETGKAAATKAITNEKITYNFLQEGTGGSL